MPCAPVTPDQWKMLQSDNVVSIGAKGLPALGVDPTPLAAVAPAWLVQHRRQGRFSKRSEEHTSELQSLMRISYAVFCLKKKTATSPHGTTNEQQYGNNLITLFLL